MVSALSKATALDPDKVKSGVEIEYLTDTRVFRLTITVGGEHNNAQQIYAEKLLRPYHKAGKTIAQLHPDKQKAIRAELMAKFVIMGWNEEDFEVPFSEETAREVLLEAPEFAAFVTEQSTNYQLFRKANNEEMAKN